MGNNTFFSINEVTFRIQCHNNNYLFHCRLALGFERNIFIFHVLSNLIYKSIFPLSCSLFMLNLHSMCTAKRIYRPNELGINKD